MIANRYPVAFSALSTSERLLPHPEPRDAGLAPSDPLPSLSPAGRQALGELLGYLETREATPEGQEEACRALAALGVGEGTEVPLEVRRRVGEALGLREPALPSWARVGALCRERGARPGAPPRLVVAVEGGEVVLNGGERVPAGYLRRGWEVVRDWDRGRSPLGLEADDGDRRQSWTYGAEGPPNPDPAPGQVWAPGEGVEVPPWTDTDGTVTIADSPATAHDGALRVTRGGTISRRTLASGWRCIGVETPLGRVMVGDEFAHDDGHTRTVVAVGDAETVMMRDEAGALQWHDGGAQLHPSFGYRRTRYAPARAGERYRYRRGDAVVRIAAADAERTTIEWGSSLHVAGAGHRLPMDAWERLDPGAQPSAPPSPATSPAATFAADCEAAALGPLADVPPEVVLAAQEEARRRPAPPPDTDAEAARRFFAAPPLRRSTGPSLTAWQGAVHFWERGR